jgi:hypothetical protein
LVSVLPQPLKTHLLVGFQNGKRKQYATQPLFDRWEAFKTLLLGKGLFEQAKVDVGGYGVSRKDETDFSCDK